MAEEPKQLAEQVMTPEEQDDAYESVLTNPKRFSAEAVEKHRKWGHTIAKPGMAPWAVSENVFTLDMLDKQIRYCQKIIKKRVVETRIRVACMKELTSLLRQRTELVREFIAAGREMEGPKTPPKTLNPPPNFAVQVNVGEKADGKSVPVEVIQRSNGAVVPGKG